MLTKTDLKLIGQVLNESIDNRVPGLINKVIDERVPKIIDQKLRPVLKAIKKLNSDVKASISFFDHRDIDTDKRVTRIENHLALQAN